MRHRVDADPPDNATAVKMLNGDIKPPLACSRKLKKVVNFYEAGELPGGYACAKCFPPDPTLPKGATVVVQLTNTQVILTRQGFFARCQRCAWVTEEVFNARHDAQAAAEGHEES
jgi:hypothetical protein